jgi:D-alanyl-D-alanine carboxypeptidase
MNRTAFWFFIFVASIICQAQNIMITDMANRRVHNQRSASQKIAVGGLAKIATSMVALDWAEASKAGVNVLMTVPANAPQIANPSPIGLLPGDQLALRDLVSAAIMADDDYAALAMGEFVGRDHLARLGKSGSALGEFSKQMNQLARREGAINTYFTNPHGLENTSRKPYSCAADIARISIYALSRPAFRFYSNQSNKSITVYRAGSPFNIQLNHNNSLIGYESVDGVQACSSASGQCCVLTAERPTTVSQAADGTSYLQHRHRMVAVVIGSSQALNEGLHALRVGWQAYDQWLAIGKPDDPRLLLNTFR